jgi:HlyD family secretion protein
MLKPNGDGNLKHFEIRSPINGVVLRVFQESSTVVTPGTPLLEVGNHADLEIVVDVLSSDAVKIKKDDEMRLEHWGGDKPLTAKVRTVEPAAFTKISALGVEEQRVNVIGDFREPSEAVAKLGDGYRVEARIVIWQKDKVLRVPASAMFRQGQEWCVFLAVDDRVEQRTIKIGQRNTNFAEVLQGLTADNHVVIYPSDQVHDGVKIAAKLMEKE